MNKSCRLHISGFMFLVASPTCVNASDGPGFDNIFVASPNETAMLEARQRLAAGERLFEPVIVRPPSGSESFGGGQREIDLSAHSTPPTVIIETFSSQASALPVQQIEAFSDITFTRLEPTASNGLILPDANTIAPLANIREERGLSLNSTMHFDSDMNAPVNDELLGISSAFSQKFDPLSFQNITMPDDLVYPDGDISNGIINGIDKFDNRNSNVERVEEAVFSTYGITPDEAFNFFGSPVRRPD